MNGSPFPLDAAAVLKVVATAYHITVEDLTGPSKRIPLSRARRVAYELIHDECQISWARAAAVLNRQGYIGGGPRSLPVDRVAVEELRHQLRPNGNQRSLFEA